MVRSWPAIYVLSYPSLHPLLDSRPREATSTVLRQDSTQTSPSASLPSFSEVFSNSSISTNLEHIFPSELLKKDCIPNNWKKKNLLPNASNSCQEIDRCTCIILSNLQKHDNTNQTLLYFICNKQNSLVRLCYGGSLQISAKQYQT